MEELFGIPMPVLMYVLFGIFIATLLVVVAMALRNTVMLKLGIRPISRRPGMTALIVIGIMLSTIIISAAFGTADTLTYSIRDIAINGLRNIDEVIIPARTGEGDEFGQSFIPMDRFEQLSADLAGDDRIDGLMPQLSENVPALNPDEDLSEGRTNLVGIDPAHLSGFGSMQTMSGGTVSLEGLAAGEAYVNERAARELELQAGGRLRIFVDDQPVDLTVKGVAENGSFAGIEPTILLPLSGAQEIFGRPESINSIAVSNLGDQLSGNELSEEVTRDLRVRFTDREAAAKLKETLGQPAFLDALEEERNNTSDPDLKTDLEALLADLRAASLTETLVGALADDDIRSVVFDILGEDDMREVQREAVTLFSELAEFLVLDIKFDILRGADQAGTGVSSFFLIFSTFSIASGIMLIFLIFVLLAGARKSEMGMARAVGAKRRHLVQMFVFEGTAYALVSAAIGVVLGLAVSALMVGVLNSVFSALDDDFTLQLNFTLPTIVVLLLPGDDYHVRDGRHLGLPCEPPGHRFGRPQPSRELGASGASEPLQPPSRPPEGHLPPGDLPLALAQVRDQAGYGPRRAPPRIHLGLADPHHVAPRHPGAALQARVALPAPGLAPHRHRRGARRGRP